MTSIDNQIEVLPVSQFDDELRFSIARAIYSNPNFRPYASMVNPPDPHHRRPRSSDAGGRGEQPGGPDAGALDREFVPRVRREERAEDEAEVKAELEKL